PVGDTDAPEALRTKSLPVVIVVGSVLSTGSALVLESDPRTLSTLPPMLRLPLITWNSGRSRSDGVAILAWTSKALPGMVSAPMPPGTVTTGVGAAALPATNGMRAGSIVMFGGKFDGPFTSGTTTLK